MCAGLEIGHRLVGLCKADTCERVFTTLHPTHPCVCAHGKACAYTKIHTPHSLSAHTARRCIIRFVIVVRVRVGCKTCFLVHHYYSIVVLALLVRARAHTVLVVCTGPIAQL
jgi:hypothetical protein